jgi:cystathionine gamma-synthase
MSTTFERDTDGSYPAGYMYSRFENPNRQMLEASLAKLEGGKAARAFSSGSAATFTLLHTLKPDDHVIAPVDVYHGTATILNKVMAPWGLQCSFVDMTNIGEVQQAIRPNTKLIWTESPSNPLLKITDIRQISELAHLNNALCISDNTWMTPALQQPFSLGADVIIHSTTKYLSGHSDVLGGAIVLKDENTLLEQIRDLQSTIGSVPSPFDCWLVLRGIQTLALRMQAHTMNADKIATYLSAHPQVEAVHYPGLETNEGHQLAAKQMSSFGGMLSIQIQGGKTKAMSVIEKTHIFTAATSFGGTSSYIEHRASIEGPGTHTPDNLLRLSIGLEHPDDLIEDLSQALTES